MSLGKGLVLGGLTLNIIGAACIAWREPHRIVVPVTRDSRVSEPATAGGRFAARWGWWFLAAGFLLQAVGTVLWT